MTSISSSFTATGVSASIYIRPFSRLDFTISDTFVGTVILQRQAGGSGWLTEKTFTGAIDSNLSTLGNAETYRWICTSYTSGTIAYTLADSTAEVLDGGQAEWKAADGTVVFKITEAGVELNGTAAGFSVDSVDDGAITLAKMADLAQDKFIVRTTASTGVPQTATVTAAARTVLDDTTVGAMVTTLGAASLSAANTFAGIQTFSAAVRPTTVALTDAATIAVDAAIGNNFSVTLGGNRVFGAPTNEAVGQVINIEIVQDGSTRIPTFNAVYKFTTSIPVPTFSTASGKRDIISFKCVAASTWRVLATNVDD